MKSSYKIAIALSTVAGVGLAVAGASLADGWKRGDHGGFGGRGMVAKAMFETFDGDGDGQVTREEVNNFVIGQMQSNDADSSGSVNLEEFEAIWLVQTRTPMVRAFQKLDRDGDGEVTQAEIDKPLNRMFAFADRNEDGAIDQSELRRGKHHRGGRHGHDRDHDGEDEVKN